MKPGTKVRLTTAYIKSWILSHDCWECHHCPMSGSKEDSEYDTMLMVALTELLGQPMYGTVIRDSYTMHGTYRVRFKFGRTINEQHYERNHLRLVKHA